MFQWRESRQQWVEPTHGWIRLKLCDISTPELNLGNYFHTEIMTNSRVWKIKERILKHHGNIDDIQLYDKDPSHFRRRQAMKEKIALEKGGIVSEQEEEGMWAEEDHFNIDKKDLLPKEKDVVFNEGLLRQRQARDQELERLRFKTYDTDSMTVYEIFGTHGVENRKELYMDTEAAAKAKGVLFYDFSYD